MMARFRNNSLW